MAKTNVLQLVQFLFKYLSVISYCLFVALGKGLSWTFATESVRERNEWLKVRRIMQGKRPINADRTISVTFSTERVTE